MIKLNLFRKGDILSIGKSIKQLRLSKYWTQKDLSKQLGLTPKMISFYEHDERIPPADILIKLSHIFNVSTDFLLGLSDDYSNKPSKNNNNPNKDLSYTFDSNNDRRVLLKKLNQNISVLTDDEITALIKITDSMKKHL